MKELHIQWPYHDHIDAEIGETGELQKLEIFGCDEVMTVFRENLQKIGKAPTKWPCPPPQKQDSHAVLLIREFILKARGEWDIPYKDPEICRCGHVQTVEVDYAIVGGAQNIRMLNRQTGACCGCTSCSADLKNMIEYRRGKI